MSDSAFFKVKSSKRSNPESRTTLDAIHSQKVQTMLEEKNNTEKYKQELIELKDKISKTTSDMDIWRLERQYEAIEKKIKSIEDGSELMQYYLRTGEILYNYYDIQDQIQQGTKTFHSSRAKPGSILALLEEVSEDSKKDNGFTAEKAPKGLQRNQLLNDYLQIEDPTMARNLTEEYDDLWTQCENCGNEMIMCLNEANLTCSKCGHQEFILVDSDKPSYKDPPREVSYYAYKRINHFNEWLAQFQAKESTEIPPEVFDMILLELKKERILDTKNIKQTKVREILKNVL